MAANNTANQNHNIKNININDNNNMKLENPYVEIVEQPAKCSLRFRYQCEGRSAGSIPGVNSTADNKTYPTIKICNYTGRAVVVVSCVSKDMPYRAHPHNIVGKDNCRDEGICTVVIDHCEGETIRSFPSIGIQCIKKKDAEKSLKVRESIRVDPFNQGFKHKDNVGAIDLSVVRLCFQVFIEGSTPGKCHVPLTPIVSDPIHDKKAMSDLVIVKLSHCSAPATGGREIILLCDRINKDDIIVRFFEETRDGELTWETFTELNSSDFHKQVAICLRTPKYLNENIAQPVMCKIQLKRVSDNQVSEPRSFQFLPCESDEDIISRKRHKAELAYYNQDQMINNYNLQASDLMQQSQLPPENRPHLHPHRPSASLQRSSNYQQQPQQQAQQQPQHRNHAHSPIQNPQDYYLQQQQQQQQQLHQPVWPRDHLTPSPMQLNSPSPYHATASSSQTQHNRPSPVTGTGRGSRQESVSPTNINNNNNIRSDNVSPNTLNASPNNPTHVIGNDSHSLRVMASCIDNSGNVIHLVDGPPDKEITAPGASSSLANRQQYGNDALEFNKTLASSLERINTAELVGNIGFNPEIVLNLGTGFSAQIEPAPQATSTQQHNNQDNNNKMNHQ